MNGVYLVKKKMKFRSRFWRLYAFLWCKDRPQIVMVGVIAGGALLPYMGHIGMCRCEGYGFQAVYSISSIRYINQSVWV